MRRALIHIGIAVLCTSIGVCIWLYVNNMIFPAKPVPFEPEEQVLRGSDVLQPAEMAADFAYLVQTIEDVHPDPYRHLGEPEWKRRKDAIQEMLSIPLSAAEYYFAMNSLVTSVGDAHTVLLFEERDKGLPLEFQWVEEGFVISEDHGEFERGDLVLMIGDRTPHELLVLMDDIVSSENIYR
ncbi:MAG: hypothetical protein ACNA7X_06665, partial [Dehalococcoidia bacterium]